MITRTLPTNHIYEILDLTLIIYIIVMIMQRIYIYIYTVRKSVSK
jgi:hypothetical protein